MVNKFQLGFCLRKPIFGFGWLGLLWLVIACSQIAAQDQRDDQQTIPLSELVGRIEQSKGDDRLRYQLELLKRIDASIADRKRVSDSLILQYADQDNPSVLAAAYAARGKAQGDAGDYVSGIETLKQAQLYAQKIVPAEPRRLFRILCNQAAFSSALGLRSEATELLLSAIELAKEHNYQSEVSFAYRVLGNIAEASGAIDKAYEYFQTALDAAVQTNNAELSAQVGINMIELALSEDDADLAEEFVQRVEPWIASSSDQRIGILLALRLQDIRHKKGDSLGAAQEIQRLIDKLEPTVDSQLLGSHYLSLASAQVAAGNFGDAIKSADLCSSLVEQIVRTWSMARILRLKAEFGLGNNEAALAGIDELLADDRLAVVHRIELLEFRSTVLASMSRFQDSLDALTQCRKIEAQRDTQRAQEVAAFITSSYGNQQRELELAASKASESAAIAQAELNESVAKQKTAETSRAKLMRDGAALLAILSVIGVAFYLRVSNKRRTDQIQARHEREMNEELTRRFALQTAQLKEQISTRQQLELAMERKFRVEALGKLTGGVAHDFNNLLTVITHSTELIRLENQQLSEESSRLLDSIICAAESGASIVNQLMAYARQQPLVSKPLLVSDWLNSNRNILKQVLGKSIQYVEISNVQDAAICIDSAQLTTAVINLLANARDALPSRFGRVEFSVERLRLDSESARAWNGLAPGEYCLFEVRDQGKGMASDELARACEPFYTTKELGSGTGLGLSSVVGFVKQSGGEFSLQSELGSGTTARFILPLTELPVHDVSPRVVARPETRNNQLLLVEDQEAVRKVLATGLQSLGYAVSQAANADDAIQLIESAGPPQILLSDVRMPGSMNGVELRNWVLSRYSNVHVVLMSGFRELDAEQDQQIVFVQKPVKLKELHRVLAG